MKHLTCQKAFFTSTMLFSRPLPLASMFYVFCARAQKSTKQGLVIDIV